jgi:hypothetical protein
MVERYDADGDRKHQRRTGNDIIAEAVPDEEDHHGANDEKRKRLFGSHVRYLRRTGRDTR